MIDLGAWIVNFLILCAGVAIVCSAIRERRASAISREAAHFFVMMVAGIVLFSGVVYLLEWAFIRRL